MESRVSNTRKRTQHPGLVTPVWFGVIALIPFCSCKYPTKIYFSDLASNFFRFSSGTCTYVTLLNTLRCFKFGLPRNIAHKLTPSFRLSKSSSGYILSFKWFRPNKVSVCFSPPTLSLLPPQPTGSFFWL